MENTHKEPKKLMLGLLIGGVVGVGALYCIQAAQNQKSPILKKIGKTISSVGEILEGDSSVVEVLEDKLPEGANLIGSITDWVDAGMTLWKKFKQG